MNINSSPVVTANLDAGTDNPSAARADILDLATKHNNNVSVLANSIEARAFLGIDSGQLFHSVSAGALTIALRTQQFASPISVDDPIKIQFPAAPTSNGNFSVRSITAPLSITIPSGATLGHTANYKCAVHVYALDVAGVVHLGVSAMYLGEVGFASATLIDVNSDSANVLYTTAATGSRLFRHLGCLTYNHATPGTWANFYVEQFRADNIPKVIFSRAKSATQLADNLGSTVVFQTAEIDTLSAYDATNNAYVPVETATYDINASIQLTGSGAGANNVTVEIRVNNVVVRTLTRPVATSAVENIRIDGRFVINAGLPVTIRVVTSTANAVTISASGTSFHGNLLSR